MHLLSNSPARPANARVRKQSLILLLAAAALGCSQTPAAAADNYDIVVYGGTAGGVAWALRAAWVVLGSLFGAHAARVAGWVVCGGFVLLWLVFKRS